MQKALTKKGAAKKMAALKKNNKPPKQGERKPTRRAARGSLKKRKTAEVLDTLAKTNAYVIKGKVKKPPRDKRGRPTVITKDVVGKLEHAFAYDCSVEEACVYAGIHRDTYYAFVELEPDFSDRVAELRTASIMVLRQTVLAGAVHSPYEALRYLERKRKQEFSLRTEVAHSGDVINRHSITPETEKLIKTAMGNFAKTMKSLAAAQPAPNARPRKT